MIDQKTGLIRLASSTFLLLDFFVSFNGFLFSSLAHVLVCDQFACFLALPLPPTIVRLDSVYFSGHDCFPFSIRVYIICSIFSLSLPFRFTYDPTVLAFSIMYTLVYVHN